MPWLVANTPIYSIKDLSFPIVPITLYLELVSLQQKEMRLISKNKYWCEQRKRYEV